MANEDFTRFTSESTPLDLTPSESRTEPLADREETYVADAPTLSEEPTTESEPVSEPTAVYEESELPFEKPKTVVFSIVSLVLSVVSLVYGFSGFIGAIFGVCAIVFAIISRAHLGFFDKKTILGLILGIVGTIFGVFIGIIDLTGIFSALDNVVGGILGDVQNDFNVQA